MTALANLNLLAAAAAPLLAQISVPADTLVVIQASPTGWTFWLNTIISVATALIALGLVAGGIAAIPLAGNLLRTLKNVNQLFAQVGRDIAPIVKHVHAVAENADYISTAARSDVERLQQTIERLNGRLDRAAGRAEERVNDFNALMKVVQEEAEDIFIGTASAVRGVRVGADAFTPFRPQGEDDAGAGADDDEAAQIRVHPRRAPRRG